MIHQHRIYFVDTSYLLELYAVPGCSDERAKAPIRSRFKAAWKRNDRLLVPLGCLMEFGNHIADISFKRERAFGNPVHIWTRDRALKGAEPDAEPDPFM